MPVRRSDIRGSLPIGKVKAGPVWPRQGSSLVSGPSVDSRFFLISELQNFRHPFSGSTGTIFHDLYTMPNTLSTTKTPTMYLATTRDNYQNWRRDLSAILATHADNLLTVVTDKKLATTVELKYHKDYKSLEMTWDTDAKLSLIHI